MILELIKNGRHVNGKRRRGQIPNTILEGCVSDANSGPRDMKHILLQTSTNQYLDSC